MALRDIGQGERNKNRARAKEVRRRRQEFKRAVTTAPTSARVGRQVASLGNILAKPQPKPRPQRPLSMIDVKRGNRYRPDPRPQRAETQRAIKATINLMGRGKHLERQEAGVHQLQDLGLLKGTGPFTKILDAHRRRQYLEAVARQRKAQKHGGGVATSLLGADVAKIPLVGTTITGAGGLAAKGLHGLGGAVATATAGGAQRLVGKDGGEILKNAVQDIFDMPIQAIPATYGLLHAGEKAVVGHDNSEFNDFLRGLRDDTALGKLLVHGDVEGALKQAKEHPVNTALEISGLHDIVGRGITKAARGSGRIADNPAARFANAEREPLRLVGGRVDPRDIRGAKGALSESAFRRGAQMATDKARMRASRAAHAEADRLEAEANTAHPRFRDAAIKQARDQRLKANRLDPNQATGRRLNYVLKRRAAIESAVSQGTTRATVQRLVNQFHDLNPDKTFADFVGAGKPPKYPIVLRGIIQSQVRRPQELEADLVKWRDRIEAESLKHAGRLKDRDWENISARIEEINRALADKKWLARESNPATQKYFTAAEHYGELRAPLQERLVEHGNLRESQVAAENIPALIAHYGESGGDYLPGGKLFPTQRKIAYEAQRARTRAEARDLARRQGIVRSEIRRREGAATSAARAEGQAMARLRGTRGAVERRTAEIERKHGQRIEELQRKHGTLKQREEQLRLVHESAQNDAITAEKELERAAKAGHEITPEQLDAAEKKFAKADRIAAQREKVAADIQQVGGRIDQLHEEGPPVGGQLSLLDRAQEARAGRAESSEGIGRNLRQLYATDARLRRQAREQGRAAAAQLRELRPTRGQSHRREFFFERTPSGEVDLTKPITPKDMEDWFAGQPSRLGQGEGPLKAIFVSDAERAPSSKVATPLGQPPRPRKRATGFTVKVGSGDIHYQGLADNLTSPVARAEAARFFQDIAAKYGIGEMVHGRQNLPELERVAERMSKELGVDMQVVNTAPFAELADVMDRIISNIQSDALRESLGVSEGQDFLREMVDAAMRTATGDVRTEGPLNATYMIMPSSQLKVIQQTAGQFTNLLAQLPGEQALRKFTHRFRMAVLPWSVRWFAGNQVEAAIRSILVEGASVSDALVAAKTLRYLKEHATQEEWDRFMSVAIGGTHFGSLARQSLYDPNPGAIGRALNAQGIRHLTGAFHHLEQRVVNTNASLEKNWMRLIFGRYMRKYAKTAQGRAAIREAQRQAAEMGKTFGMMEKWLKVSEAHLKAYHEALGDPDRVAQLIQYSWRVLGRYAAHGPTERFFINHYTPFWDWYRNAMFFMFRTLPVDHPVITGTLALLEDVSRQALESDGQVHNVLGQHDGALPSYFLGSIKEKDRRLRIEHYTPFSAFQDPLESASSLVLPQISGLSEALRGKTWTGADLTMSSGDAPGLINKLAYALNETITSTVPLASQAQQVLSHSGSPYADSFPLLGRIRNRPDSEEPLGRSARRLYDPFITTRSGKPKKKKKAASGASFSGGASFGGGASFSGGASFGGR